MRMTGVCPSFLMFTYLIHDDDDNVVVDDDDLLILVFPLLYSLFTFTCLPQLVQAQAKSNKTAVRLDKLTVLYSRFGRLQPNWQEVHYMYL
jgi:hypothetical protein